MRATASALPLITVTTPRTATSALPRLRRGSILPHRVRSAAPIKTECVQPTDHLILFLTFTMLKIPESAAPANARAIVEFAPTRPGH
ncbi:hypothetical protein PF005_g15562 [Phytophthora fragariae]|uniref:Uncharacterized protein n=1 Tax=Phytophthora fragariae TaxID=53985 RepID=A0A6A3VYA2_9STRA|nr:hypothetical protein PF003_g28547 [Phytophthora fragariae]KAE8999470.1 hypothetical protein PF011_g14614 [Phytophthora fragariae]KAE9091197.1 hypothetical protein PF006_g24978 [Phytophthora fragariae]KAE9100185.1 hypothetical protein PF010_g14904 [Phytophthora fragariae]KAE9169934.1 hypothetical protein PF002_g30223 [Phytophthora fragariae]